MFSYSGKSSSAVGLPVPSPGAVATLLGALMSGINQSRSEYLLRARDPPRHSMLFAVELAVYKLGVMLVLAMARPEQFQGGAFKNISGAAFVLFLNGSLGGVVVAMVNGSAGGDWKGLALIMGLIGSLVGSSLYNPAGVTITKLTAAAVSITSLVFYNKFPVQTKPAGTGQRHITKQAQPEAPAQHGLVRLRRREGYRQVEGTSTRSATPGLRRSSRISARAAQTLE
mmetsp:Transcript_22968/g.45387  ORF Transcript_22968/g.45387 Transcript_22968/m.45387 type:complete len:227 (+) Transcript_22968:3-683(+)